MGAHEPRTRRVRVGGRRGEKNLTSSTCPVSFVHRRSVNLLLYDVDHTSSSRPYCVFLHLNQITKPERIIVTSTGRSSTIYFGILRLDFARVDLRIVFHDSTPPFHFVHLNESNSPVISLLAEMDRLTFSITK